MTLSIVPWRLVGGGVGKWRVLRVEESRIGRVCLVDVRVEQEDWISGRLESGVGIISRLVGSEALGVSRVLDLRERDGDRDAILDRSSSSQ